MILSRITHKEVGIITIKEFAEMSGINYSTCRKYISLLKERNAMEEPTEEWVDVFQDIYTYTKKGDTLDEAIDKALGKERNISDSEKLDALYNEIQELRKENRQLSDLNQMYLSKIDDLYTMMHNVQKALPPPDEGFWGSFLRMLGIRRKNKKEGS